MLIHFSRQKDETEIAIEIVMWKLYPCHQIWCICLLFLISCTFLLIYLNEFCNSDFTCFSVYVCDMRINYKNPLNWTELKMVTGCLRMIKSLLIFTRRLKKIIVSYDNMGLCLCIYRLAPDPKISVFNKLNSFF